MHKARSWSNSAPTSARQGGKRHTPPGRIPDSTPLPFPETETPPARATRTRSETPPHAEKMKVVATTDSRRMRARPKPQPHREAGPQFLPPKPALAENTTPPARV